MIRRERCKEWPVCWVKVLNQRHQYGFCMMMSFDSITVSDDDLVAIATGKSNPQQLFMKGKLKVKGNILLTTKLDQLFSSRSVQNCKRWTLASGWDSCMMTWFDYDYQNALRQAVVFSIFSSVKNRSCETQFYITKMAEKCILVVVVKHIMKMCYVNHSLLYLALL